MINEADVQFNPSVAARSGGGYAVVYQDLHHTATRRRLSHAGLRCERREPRNRSRRQYRRCRAPIRGLIPTSPVSVTAA